MNVLLVRILPVRGLSCTCVALSAAGLQAQVQQVKLSSTHQYVS